ncbi:MAG: hypothetical protein QOE70_2476 [Chthoniobacter sp.]|nr:hypothetical protein [Chthoniobacter sp.]
MKAADGTFSAVEKPAAWDPRKTALIICDMWDDHWCKSAARRVVELAGPLNETVNAARARGVFIIHAPSSVTAFYKDTPQRKRAQAAPFASTPVPLATAERWSTTWCWTDPKIEAVLAIDDSDMGCSCTGAKCEIKPPWTRQIASIELAPEDALTDDGQETWNLLVARGIDHVILCGVHLNMCVLGRPFAIRQMVYLGKDVALAELAFGHARKVQIGELVLEKRPVQRPFRERDLETRLFVGSARDPGQAQRGRRGGGQMEKTAAGRGGMRHGESRLERRRRCPLFGFEDRRHPW